MGLVQVSYLERDEGILSEKKHHAMRYSGWNDKVPASRRHCVLQPLKDALSDSIEQWKKSGAVEYTGHGNPKAPEKEMVFSWISESWKKISKQTVIKGPKTPHKS